MTPKERDTYNRYHLPGSSNLHKRKVDTICISVANSLEHELKKTEICYEIQKMGGHFITESCRNKPDKEGKIRRVDIVDLSGKEIQVVYKHESHEEVAEYREKGIIVIIINPFKCKVCGLEYPKRNEKGICKLCENENL